MNPTRPLIHPRPNIKLDPFERAMQQEGPPVVAPSIWKGVASGVGISALLVAAGWLLVRWVWG